jgi:hypothetical protein
MNPESIAGNCHGVPELSMEEARAIDAELDDLEPTTFVKVSDTQNEGDERTGGTAHQAAPGRKQRKRRNDPLFAAPVWNLFD